MAWLQGFVTARIPQSRLFTRVIFVRAASQYQLQPPTQEPRTKSSIAKRPASADPSPSAIPTMGIKQVSTIPVLPPQYSSRLFRSSFTTCFSICLAVRHELWSCAAVALLVLLTSLNYWRDPVLGWRRTLDMSAVFLAIVYHVYCSAFCEQRIYQAVYLLFILKTAYCYRRARDAPNKDVSSAWHCGVHVVGNIANMLLYTGLAV